MVLSSRSFDDPFHARIVEDPVPMHTDAAELLIDAVDSARFTHRTITGEPLQIVGVVFRKIFLEDSA